MVFSFYKFIAEIFWFSRVKIIVLAATSRISAIIKKILQREWKDEGARQQSRWILAILWEWRIERARRKEENCFHPADGNESISRFTISYSNFIWLLPVAFLYASYVRSQPLYLYVRNILIGTHVTQKNCERDFLTKSVITLFSAISF